jgi:hypothetical protein
MVAKRVRKLWERFVTAALSSRSPCAHLMTLFLKNLQLMVNVRSKLGLLLSEVAALIPTFVSSATEETIRN